MLPPSRTELMRDALLAPADYELVREARLREAAAEARDRALPFGPAAALQFCSYAAAWVVAHERLRSHGRDEAGVVAALREANALIPDGPELVARLEAQRGGAPADLAGHMALEFAGETVRGACRVSGVVRFFLTPGQIERFRQPGIQVVVVSDAADYAHRVAMPDPMRQTLAAGLP